MAGIVLWLLAAACGIYIVCLVNPAPVDTAVQKLAQAAEQGAARAMKSCLKNASAQTGYLLGEYREAKPGVIQEDPSYEDFLKRQARD